VMLQMIVHSQNTKCAKKTREISRAFD